MRAYFIPTWLRFKGVLQVTLLGSGLALAAGSSGTAKPKPNSVFTMANPRCTAEPPPLLKDMIQRASFSCRFNGGVPKVHMTKKGRAKGVSCSAGTFLHGFVATCDGAAFNAKMLPRVESPAAATSTLTPKALLAAHNTYRTRLNLKPLTWSDRLTTEAAKWAAHLVALGGTRVVYSNPAKTGQGENIWIGPRGSLTAEQIIAAWGNARQPEKYKLVGCALAHTKKNTIVVCRYWPPGG